MVENSVSPIATFWVCSVLWSDELEPFPPKKHDFKYCAEKSLAVDEAYRQKLEPEVGAGSSPGHQRWYSPSRGSKNSDTSSRNSKRNRKNAEATNENAINGQESSRSSDDESEPLTKSSSLIKQYSADSKNSQWSKISSGRDSQRSTSSNGGDNQRSTSSNNKSIQRSKGEKKEYIEAIKRAAIAANTVFLKPSIEKGGGAHGMKSKAEMAKDWVASHGKKLWDRGREGVLKTGKTWKENGGGAHRMKNKAEMAKDWVASHGKKLWDKGREDVLKTGKALIENGGGAHRMKSKAGKVTDWVASLGRKFWDTSRKDVLKTGNPGNRQEGSRSSDGDDTASTKYYSFTTQHSDDSSSSQRSQSSSTNSQRSQSSSTNSQRSKRSNGRESQRSRSRKRENFEAERQAVAVAAAAFAASGALDDARVKKDEKTDKIRNKQKMVKEWMDSDGKHSWGTGGESDLRTGYSHQHDVKSPVRDSPKVRNTGRANSPSSSNSPSSPNHAFCGISLTVKLNKYHPGDVSINP